uniref:Uncharacterized protein n=1 Tax=Nelumbo nucifera TaxID=4432 RepID=A0A822ZEN6_NELNU|nr:TPA_asm: hypothetical protein HUJ06_016188 [Nelumbo nucifera]
MLHKNIIIIDIQEMTGGSCKRLVAKLSHSSNGADSVNQYIHLLEKICGAALPQSVVGAHSMFT